MTDSRIKSAINLARIIRADALRMVHAAKASHIGSSLSSADILAVLYDHILNVNPERPDWSERDRFVLSKGHGVAILYAVLAEKGFFPKDALWTYCQNGSTLMGHISHHVPGVEISTGSLGHGLPIGCGLALAAKRDGKDYRTYVLLGDGEMDEGSNWEAMLFAAHHKLDNLIAIVDYNKIQSFGNVKDVLDLEPFTDKWRSFRWCVREINGHAHTEISDALKNIPIADGKPTAIIAHTCKGKGVSFMENLLAWHYKTPTDEELAQALAELGGDT
ncbi:transketolase [Smithella sp. F21]|nr:transketolase [Smithella sp. F21]